MKYTVVSSIDYQEFGTYSTLKEAKKQIERLKAFDKKEGNPFDEGYFIRKDENDD